MDKQPPCDRRSGKDRRQTEAGPPDKHERRRSIEPRQPEVRELHLSPEEWVAMGFGDARAEPFQPKQTS